MQLKLFYTDVQYADRIPQHFYFHATQNVGPKYLVLYNGDTSHDTLTDKTIESALELMLFNNISSKSAQVREETLDLLIDRGIIR